MAGQQMQGLEPPLLTVGHAHGPGLGLASWALRAASILPAMESVVMSEHQTLLGLRGRSADLKR